MKNKKIYKFGDIANIVMFFFALACFISVSIVSIVGLIQAPSISEIPDVLTKKDFFMELIQRLGMIIVVFVPLILRKLFRLNIPNGVTITYYIFMLLSTFLGSFLDVYETFKHWDKFVHFLSGILISILGIYILNAFISDNMPAKKRIGLTIVFMIVFSMAIAAFWEIYEFTFDGLLGLNSQKYTNVDGVLFVGRQALMDTMLDCISCLFGTLLSLLILPIGLSRNKNFLNSFKISRYEKVDRNKVNTNIVQ